MIDVYIYIENNDYRDPRLRCLPNSQGCWADSDATLLAASFCSSPAMRTPGTFSFILIKMHEKRGNFCIFLSKIAEKEGKTDLGRPVRSSLVQFHPLIVRSAQKLSGNGKMLNVSTFIVQFGLTLPTCGE